MGTYIYRTKMQFCVVAEVVVRVLAVVRVVAVARVVAVVSAVVAAQARQRFRPVSR